MLSNSFIPAYPVPHITHTLLPDCPLVHPPSSRVMLVFRIVYSVGLSRFKAILPAQNGIIIYLSAMRYSPVFITKELAAIIEPGNKEATSVHVVRFFT